MKTLFRIALSLAVAAAVCCTVVCCVRHLLDTRRENLYVPADL